MERPVPMTSQANTQTATQRQVALYLRPSWSCDQPPRKWHCASTLQQQQMSKYNKIFLWKRHLVHVAALSATHADCNFCGTLSGSGHILSSCQDCFAVCDLTRASVLKLCAQYKSATCRYATHVHEALTGLVADPDQDVRRLMALQFRDICTMLGKERCAQYMKR